MNILSSMLNFIADKFTSIGESITALGTRMTTAESTISGLSNRTTNFYVFRATAISAESDAGAIGAMLQDILNRNLGDITFVCYIFRTGAWQLNGYGSIRNGDARATFFNGNNGQILVVSKTSTTAINVIKTYS